MKNTLVNILLAIAIDYTELAKIYFARDYLSFATNAQTNARDYEDTARDVENSKYVLYTQEDVDRFQKVLKNVENRLHRVRQAA